MKEVLILMAQYNLETDDEMMNIVYQIPDEKFFGEVGVYYKSLHGILNHIILVNLLWMRRITKQFNEFSEVTHKYKGIDFAGLKNIVFTEKVDLKANLLDTDKDLKEICDKMGSNTLIKSLNYKNTKGEERSKVMWHVFMHIFNHATHHRGQISALLDQFNMDNDYSNLIWKV
ncbi:DinB family protein [Flexistipes sinusarabici DSM 4947]|uniref:DinB family protein n=2 Tax=Flexistipes sinusarabici TaxID=2352 RepID=F8E6D2_FLESM|nr:DinB family protein [Flexistipes sinusarabici]AEI15899.1 DinB family protein [Flexistipes sinusarabici DSM 4947]HCW92631.1 hypothetical protein [Flexistipes sinusarabici]